MGQIEWTETLIPGIDMVATASHGGIMVSREASFLLTPAARKCGVWMGGFLCFEEDADENVVLRELLDQNLWQIPDQIKDRAAFEADINRNIQTWNPDYWQALEKRMPAGNRLSGNAGNQIEQRYGGVIPLRGGYSADAVPVKAGRLLAQSPRADRRGRRSGLDWAAPAEVL